MPVQRKLSITDYYNQQISDICFFLERIPDSHKKKDIHQLRVRIKRLKSLFLLLEYIYTSDFSAKDNYSLFRPVFKSAGLLRELQVNRDLLKKFGGTDELRKAYGGYAREILPGMTEDLDRAIAGYDYSRLDIISSRVEELFGKHKEAGLVDRITRFIAYEIGRIRPLADDPGQVDNIHDIRIMLKNIKPLLLLIFPLPCSAFDKVHYSKLSDTDRSIGKWHDMHVLSVSLSSFFNACVDSNSGIYHEYLALAENFEKKKRKALGRARKSVAATLLFFSEDPSSV